MSTTESTGIGRVLAVSADAERTGSAPWLRDLLTWARAERGVEVEVMVLRDGPLTPELGRLGAVHVPPAAVTRATSVAQALHRPRWARAARRRWIRRVLAAVGPVEVVVAGSPDAVDALRDHGGLAPIVAHVAGAGRLAPQAAGTLHRARLVVAPTAPAAEWAARRPEAGGLGVPAGRLRLHAGPVDPPLRHPRADLDDSALVVGCGPVGWRSGTDRFLAVAAAVGPEVAGRALRFTWLGDLDHDDSGQDVVDDISLRGLGDLVHLVGDVEDQSARIAAADLLLVTGRDDPYPLAVVEAALAGTPVAGFRPGTALLAEAGHDDRRIDRLDVEALAAQVTSMVADRDEGRLLAGDLARAAAAATTPLAAAALWADIEAAVAGGPGGRR